MQGVVYAKGTLDSTDYTINSDSSVTIVSGYYSGDATSLYQQGYTDGYASKSNGNITYQIGHVHTGSDTAYGGCYTTEDTSRSYRCGKSVTMEWNGYRYEGYCPNGHFVAWSIENTGYHLHTVTCPYSRIYYKQSCGLETDEIVRETDTPTGLTSNERIVSATITY